MSSMEGKIFTITGAASGIGRATALHLASKGALLSLADMDEAGLESLVQELREKCDTKVERGLKYNGKVFHMTVDVRDKQAVEKWIQETVDFCEGKKLDGAANLAGLSGSLGPVRSFSSEIYDSVFSVNVAGTFHCLSAELRSMNKGGSIVNAGSIAGLVGKPDASIYCASKHAVIGLTKAAAREEITNGIRVNAVAPGFVDTPLMHKLDAELGFQIPTSECLDGRRATPDEVAKLIVFLLSDEASYTTGSVYSMDGGMLC